MTTSPFKGGLQADIDRDPLRDEIQRLREFGEAIQARLDQQVQSYKNLRDVASHAVTDLLMQDPSLAWNTELRELGFALDLTDLFTEAMQGDSS